MDLRSQVKSGFQEIESGQLSNDADISSKVRKEILWQHGHHGDVFMGCESREPN